MAVKPILFNTDMVRAILDGRKTVTRRVIEPQPPEWSIFRKMSEKKWMWTVDMCEGTFVEPYSKGDILYVREELLRDWYKTGIKIKDGRLVYDPPIWLKVTNVRVQRLKDITFYEIKEEGINPEQFKIGNSIRAKEFVESYVSLWDSTIKKKDLPLYGWDANPWVWVIEFERAAKPDE